MRRLAILFLLLVAFGLSAQESPESIGVIVFAEGDEISILRGRELERHDAARALGEPLFAGDQVTTAEGTYAELQLLTSRNIVKISENTTFTIEQLSSGGASELSVAYGRVRSRVEALTGTQRFAVRGLTAVAGVRGTDFGFDQVIDGASGEIVSRIYTFEGEVTVSSSDNAQITATLGAGEMIAVSIGASSVPEPEPIPDAVREYWTARGFRESYREPDALLERFPRLDERVLEETGVSDVYSLMSAAGPGDAGSQPGDPTTQDGPQQTDDPEEPSAVGEPDSPAEPVGSNETEEQPPLAEPAETRQSDEAGVSSAAEDEAPEGESTLGPFLRTTGVILTATGLTADLVAVGLYYFGNDLFTGWDPAIDDYLGPAVGIGLGVAAAGLLSILIGGAL